jgi:peroxiredoxin
MINSAVHLERYEQVISLSEQLLKTYPDDPSAWEVRSSQLRSLLATWRAEKARTEWERASSPLRMESGQIILDLGLEIAEGLADEGRVDSTRAMYDAIRKRFSFVPSLESVLGPKSEALHWVGKEPPELEGKDLEGRTVKLSDYRGKVILLDFWATWCRPCVEEMPALIDAWRRYHDRGFVVIGVSLDNGRQDVERFVERWGVSWPILVDGRSWNGPNPRKYAVSAIPAEFWIDRTGRIARVGKPTRGYDPFIEMLLNKKQAPTP